MISSHSPKIIVYIDWERSGEGQAAALDEVIREIF